jgi:hexosaminidase
VDDDSFPLVMSSYPNISYYGGFESDQLYTSQMVSDIVSYAAKLGIRVVPEFDNPGHVRAIGNDPDFISSILCFKKDWAYNVPNGGYKIKGGPPTGVLDPSSNKTYDLLQGLFNDYKALFPDNMIHLGGDEVLQSCFNENPLLKDFMAEHNLISYDDLIVFHMQKTRVMLENTDANKKALYWSNEDTFYQKYKAGDVLVYWGHS